jgi:cytochrome c5
MDTLYKHALEGFTGAKGMMPARGGAATLSDDEVKAAVNHMVSLSQ